jgi:hypothetical protein
MPGWLVTACRLTDGVVEHALISKPTAPTVSVVAATNLQ